MRSTSPPEPQQGQGSAHQARLISTPAPPSLHLPASSLLVLCTCDSPSCHRALLSLDASSWNLPITCHHFTQWIPIHSPGLDSNITCSGNLCWGPPVQLWTVTNSVVTNLQFTSLLIHLLVWPFFHSLHCFFRYMMEWVLSVWAHKYIPSTPVSGSVQMHNKCLMNE